MPDAPLPYPVSPPLPEVDAAAMREVDRLMVEQYGIVLAQMMENAGRALADLTRRRFLDGDPRDRRVVVLAGTGGNGGGALTAGRRLAGWGARIDVVLTGPAVGLTEVPRLQWEILGRLPGVRAVDGAAELRRRPEPSPGRRGSPGPDVVIDGLVGYSLSGDPRGAVADLVAWANDLSTGSGTPVVSLDVPSGYDASTGAMRAPAVRAAATLTLALPKRGMQSAELAPWVGELYCADISVPPALYREPSVGVDDPPVFWGGDVVALPDLRPDRR